MEHNRAKTGRTLRKNRLKIFFSALGLILIVAVIATGVLAFADPDSLKDVAVDLLGDEGRDQLVALYTSATARTPETNDLAPMSYTGLNPFGVNVFLEQEVDESKMRRTLQMIKDAGFGWVKQEVLWSDIEIPAKGEYWDAKNNVDSWAKYDRIVNLVNEYGLNLILRLDTSPAWARKGTNKIETPPDNFDDFGDFVYTIVKRYKGRVKYYMIWNEPNTAFEWGNRPVNAKEYVRLLKTAYLRAKQADPNVVILAAALAPTIEVSDRAVNDVMFLQQMYDAGAKDYFDIMSANPYGLRSGPYDRRLDGDKDVNFSRPVLLREVMVRNGDANKPIWASEMGWNALPPDFPEEPIFGRVTREQQARYTVAGLRRILEEWPWMGVVNLWHFRRVFPVNQKEQMYYFGLVGYDFTRFPVYDAVAQFAKSPPMVYRGYHQEDHWALHYSGGWLTEKNQEASLGGYKVTSKAGDSVSFIFKGSSVNLILPKGPNVGGYYVTVDGGAPNLVAKDSSGKAFINLHSNTEEWQQVVPVVSNLGYGEHSLVLVAAPGSSGNADTKWYFDAFVVDGKPSNFLVLIWPGAAIVGGIAVGIALARLFGAFVLVRSSRE